MKLKPYGLIVCLCFLSSITIAQPLSEELSVNKISDSLAVIDVNGTNVGVLASAKGLVLVDPAIDEENKQRFLDQTRRLSDSPLKYVLITHGASDHSRGNKIFSMLGASILSSDYASFSPAYTELTFDAGLLFDMGSHQLRAINVASNTYDDWIIYFEKENTIFTGDVFTTQGHPQFYIGGFAGQKQAIDKILSVANEDTRIVPGHGSVANIEDVRTYMANTTELYNQVRSLYEAGNSVEQIQADPKYQEAMLRFNGDSDEDFLNRKSVREFVSRLISGEFLAAQEIDQQTSELIIGTYALRDRSTIEVLRKDSRIFARKRRGFHYELVPQNDGTSFHVRGSLGGLARFIPNSKNTKIKQLELDVEGVSYVAKKKRR